MNKGKRNMGLIRWCKMDSDEIEKKMIEIMESLVTALDYTAQDPHHELTVSLDELNYCTEYLKNLFKWEKTIIRHMGFME